jgi:heme exporter protein D
MRSGSSAKRGLWERLKPLGPWLPLVAATLLVAGVTTHAILSATHGTPAAPLDDAYIHFQYVRDLVALHPFSYSPGAAPTPGETSLLWPVLLAPFYAVGLRGASIVYAAWALGWTALGLLAYDTFHASRHLISREGAIAAAAMVLTFGGYVWFAPSGMEVVPFAWLLMRSVRRAAEWTEQELPRGARRARVELVVLGVAAPLMRPEGALASAFIALTLLVFPRGGRRAWALAPLAGPLLVPALNALGTGQFTSSTAAVKWLPLNPYEHGAVLFHSIADNLRVLFVTLLDGRVWSAEFLPTGSKFVAWLVPPALVLAGVRRSRGWRAFGVLAVALGMLIPASYESFLWNRLRYLWPFAAAWFVGLAALADEVGAWAERVRPSLGSIGVLVAGGFVGALATHLRFAVGDVANSAAAILGQQVALGHWAHDALGTGARIGVNDAGAIAYFSDCRVFDMVGLTTRGEARYWVAGAGSRFEHYEHLPRAKLPTYFIVYPGWLGISPLLGRELTERTITGPGATILGGTTMVAAVADYSTLGTGDLPRPPPAGRALSDALDVADLESEAAHGYSVFWGTQADDLVVESGDGAADGARARRTLDAFRLKLVHGGVLVARLGSSDTVALRVTVDGRAAGKLRLEGDPWQQVELALPDRVPSGQHVVAVAAPAGQTFTSMHYWAYGPHPLAR